MKHPPTELAHRDVRRIILGIMLAMFLGALDQTIVATALPTIGAEFGDFANLPWVVTSYLLAATVATPLYGKLSDIRGRRVMLLISVAVFSTSSTTRRWRARRSSPVFGLMSAWMSVSWP